MKGDWFAWLSHDDIYLPQKTKIENTYIKKYPNSKVFFCNTGLMKANGKVIRNPNPVFKQKIRGGKWNLFNWIYGCSILIHKDVFEDVGMFSPKHSTNQDQEMIYRLLNNYTFTHIPKVLVYRREHQESGIAQNRQLNEKETINLYKSLFIKNGIAYFFPELKNSKNKVNISKSLNKMARFFLIRGNLVLAEFFFNQSQKTFNSIKNPACIISVFPLKYTHLIISTYLNIRNLFNGFKQKIKNALQN